jgi:hypothetical protein
MIIGTVATGSSPGYLASGLAVNPFTDKVYVADVGQASFSAGGATVIFDQETQAIPLTTAIDPLPANTVYTATPQFTLTAASTFSPVAPTPQNVYFQLDTWQGAWTQAAQPGGIGTAFTAAVTARLQAGIHILYAYAEDGRSSSSTQASSPAIGNIASYLFLVIPAGIAATAGTPQSASDFTAFATNLQATVTDAAGNPISGAVAFAAPVSGPSGTFAGSTAVTTNASGIATAPNSPPTRHWAVTR